MRLAEIVLGAALIYPCARAGQVAQPITGTPYCTNSKHGLCQTCRFDAPMLGRPAPTPRKPAGHRVRGYQRG